MASLIEQIKKAKALYEDEKQRNEQTKQRLQQVLDTYNEHFAQLRKENKEMEEYEALLGDALVIEEEPDHIEEDEVLDDEAYIHSVQARADVCPDEKTTRPKISFRRIPTEDLKQDTATLIADIVSMA